MLYEVDAVSFKPGVARQGLGVLSVHRIGLSLKKVREMSQVRNGNNEFSHHHNGGDDERGVVEALYDVSERLGEVPGEVGGGAPVPHAHLVQAAVLELHNVQAEVGAEAAGVERDATRQAIHLNLDNYLLCFRKVLLSRKAPFPLAK